MDVEIASIGSDDLVVLYRKLEGELKKQLLEGASWQELKERQTLLTSISKELSKRNIPSRYIDKNPAGTPLR